MFALLFGTAIALSRTELTISKDAKWAARREHERVVDAVQRLEATLLGELSGLNFHRLCYFLCLWVWRTPC